MKYAGLSYVMEKLAYNISEVAELLGISKSYAYHLAKENKLPILELGKRKIILKVSLERWLQEKTSIK